MIHVIAVITAKPGMRDSILTHFRANVPAVRAEQGCIEYGATVDAENALPFQTKCGTDTFLVVEKWESMDALKAHAAAPHMAAYGAKTKEFIASRIIHILQPAYFLEVLLEVRSRSGFRASSSIGINTYRLTPNSCGALPQDVPASAHFVPACRRPRQIGQCWPQWPHRWRCPSRCR